MVEDAEADGVRPGIESEGRRARGQRGTQEHGRGETGERGRYSVTA